MNDNVEIVIYNKADELVKAHFESLLSKHQIGLEKSIKGDFIFDCVNL